MNNSELLTNGGLTSAPCTLGHGGAGSVHYDTGGAVGREEAGLCVGHIGIGGAGHSLATCDLLFLENLREEAK